MTLGPWCSGRNRNREVAICLNKHEIHNAYTKARKAILMEVKSKSLAKKGLLNDDEFLDIVREILPGRVS